MGVVVHIRVYVCPLCVYVYGYERESANLIFGERKKQKQKKNVFELYLFNCNFVPFVSFFLLLFFVLFVGLFCVGWFVLLLFLLLFFFFFFYCFNLFFIKTFLSLLHN